MVNLTEQQICEAYSIAKSAMGAARLLGVKFDTYKKYALKYGCYEKNQAGIGIDKKKPDYIEKGDFNYHYFDNLDSTEKAYILGFTAADGAPKNTSITYNLSVVDTEILEYFCDCLETNKDRLVKYKSCSVKGDERKYFDAVSLRLYSKHFLTMLSQYNIVTNRVKNNLQMLAYIPDKYKDAWIAGYIDGNGCISSTGKEITISSNKDTIMALIDHVKTYSENLKYRIVDHESFTELYITDREFTLRYVYSCPFHLSRKIEKANSILHRFIETSSRSNYKMHNNVKVNKCIDCGCLISPSAVRCKSCSGQYKNKCSTNRPSKAELLISLKCCNFLEVGRYYGVTDNAVRKWCKFYGLPYKTKELKQYFSL